MKWTVTVVAALLYGCGPAAPPQSNVHLAMVDYWPGKRLLFIAAPNSGVVNVLRVPPNPQQAGLEFVERLEHPTRRYVIRLVVDRQRGRLWIADAYAVHIYSYQHDLSLPATIVPLPSADPRFAISDLSIDEEGNGYAHTGGGARIYRIDGASYALEQWLDPFANVLGTAAVLNTMHNRALHTRDQRYVLFQSPIYDMLLRIDLRSKSVSQMQMNPPVNLNCGLLFWKGDSDTLRAMDCQGFWATDIELQPGLERAMVRSVRSAGTQ